MARRMVGVPGYQYNIDASKEYFIRQIFTYNELQLIKEIFQNDPGFEYRRNFLFDEKIRVLEIQRMKKVTDSNDTIESEPDCLFHLLQLNHRSELKITDLSDETYKKALNDKKFYELSFKDRALVRLNTIIAKLYQYRVGKSFLENGVGLLLFLMSNQIKKKSNDKKSTKNLLWICLVLLTSFITISFLLSY